MEAPIEPFGLAWVRTARFGALAAVHLPGGISAVDAGVLGRLAPDERAHAVAERGRRQIEFAGGRFAARAAAEHLGAAWGPLCRDSEGVPLAPPGLAVSLTHKTDLAVALVAPDAGGSLGVDLEGDGRARPAIASRVCRPEELVVVEALAPEAQWPAILARFALKEALYKAAFPRVRHFFGFQAARVELQPELKIVLELPPEDPKLEIEAELEWLTPQRVLAMVRVR